MGTQDDLETPPHNEHAERALLGAYLLRPDLLDDPEAVIQPDDLYLLQHKRVYAAIRELHAGGVAIDSVTLAELLGDDAEAARIALDLIRPETTPHAESAPHYAAIVREKAARRNLIETAREAERLALDPGWRPPVAAPDRSLVQTWQPFPTACLPEPLAGYVRASAAAIGCDESFVALPLLAAVAGTVGNARRARIKRDYSEPAVVWVATVGESGSQKSPAWEAALRPVFDRQRDARREFKAAFAKWQADQAAWKEASDLAKKAGEGIQPEPQQPSYPALWIDDATIEAVGAILSENERGTLVAAEELAAWFGSFDQYRSGKGSDREKWLRMFGGRELRIDRKTGTPQTLYVPFASVSIAGTIQPGVLRKRLTAENRESGMASRLLLAWPPRRPIRWTEAEVDEAMAAAVADLFEKLYALDLDTDRHGERQPGLVPLSAEAKPLFRQFVDEHGEQHAERTGDLAAVWSKLIGYAARFALLFSLVRRATGETCGLTEEIDAQSMADAIALARWFSHEAERVYRLIDADAVERQQNELVEWVRRKGGSVTPRDLQRGHVGYREPGKAEAALRALHARGLARRELRAAGRTGGRPSEIFILIG